MGPDQDGHYERLITGDMSGQTWFGIYSTGNAPDLQGTSGSEANFGGYKEIVLDNIPEVIGKLERIRLTRGAFVSFNMGYYENDRSGKNRL